MDVIPVPDFSCENDDYIPFFSLSTSHHCSLTFSDKQDLEQFHDLQIIDDTPFRCTSNSAVYLCQTPYDQSLWALKVTRQKKRIHEEALKRKQFPRCQFLVETIKCFEIQDKAYLQMEFCSHQDIAAIQFNEQDVWQLIFDIGNALAIIHEAGWMHLDVSPMNILRTDEQFKLTDFATVTQIGDFSEGKEGAGPYVSPEALRYPLNEYPVDTQTDIFSFGLVLLEALAGRHAPRGGTENYLMIRQGMIKLGSDVYPCPCSKEMKDLVNLMLSPNPNDRPTARMLVEIARFRF